MEEIWCDGRDDWGWRGVGLAAQDREGLFKLKQTKPGYTKQ